MNIKPNKIECKNGVCKLFLAGKEKKISLFSEESLALIKTYHWNLHRNHGRGFYVRSTYIKKNNKITGGIFMHQLLMKNKNKGYVVDHINRDGLDNRLNNLRIITRGENRYNSKTNHNNTSGKRGVTFNKGKWVARISVNGVRIFLGVFISKEDAINARDISERQYYPKMV